MRDDYKCRRCFSSANLELHHILPTSRGGLDIETNLIILCRDCHDFVQKNYVLGYFDVMDVLLRIIEDRKGHSLPKPLKNKTKTKVIGIDMNVYKRLDILRQKHRESFNSVISRLLGLETL
jgi:hypothetical protein